MESILQNSSQAKQQIENKSDVSTRSRFHLKAGDVLISNATSSWGLTGHAAIAISSKKYYIFMVKVIIQLHILYLGLRKDMLRKVNG